MSKLVIKWINKTFDFRNLLKSRVILYLLFVAALVQLYVFSITGDYVIATLLLLVGFLVSFFSKNMIVILCLALVIANIFKYGLVEVKEGFKEENDDSKKSVLEKSKDDLKLFKDEISQDSKKDKSELNKVDEKPSISKKEKKVSFDDDVDVKKMAKAKAQIPEGDKESQLEYKNLLELQLKLIDGISNIKPVLTEVVDKIEKLKARD
jgi:hypothetical protein